MRGASYRAYIVYLSRRARLVVPSPVDPYALFTDVVTPGSQHAVRLRADLGRTTHTPARRIEPPRRPPGYCDVTQGTRTHAAPRETGNLARGPPAPYEHDADGTGTRTTGRPTGASAVGPSVVAPCRQESAGTCCGPARPEDARRGEPCSRECHGRGSRVAAGSPGLWPPARRGGREEAGDASALRCRGRSLCSMSLRSYTSRMNLFLPSVQPGLHHRSRWSTRYISGRVTMYVVRPVVCNEWPRPRSPQVPERLAIRTFLPSSPHALPSVPSAHRSISTPHSTVVAGTPQHVPRVAPYAFPTARTVAHLCGPIPLLSP